MVHFTGNIEKNRLNVKKLLHVVVTKILYALTHMKLHPQTHIHTLFLHLPKKELSEIKNQT